MTRILAIDPGTRESGIAIYDTTLRLPTYSAKLTNGETMLALTEQLYDVLAIEMVAHYGLGMPAGKDVFETCVWIGRFYECARRDAARRMEECPRIQIVYRADVKMHLCNSMRAKDSNIIQAIKDLYGGERSISVGTKAAPGPLYGFKADAWQALGVALTAAHGLAQEALTA